MSPCHQILPQLTAVISSFFMTWFVSWCLKTVWDWQLFCFLAGGSAFLLARYLKQPWWWQLIHFLFFPLVWAALHLSIPPGYYLLALLFTLLIFRGAPSEQIPLYFSNRQTSKFLSLYLPPGLSFIDLGAGIGSILYPLARLRPDLLLNGIENAPAPWIIGRLRCLGSPQIRWYWGSFWEHSLAPYDVAYCFLSPTPMTRLWAKAQAEMAPGSLFISKEFPVPDASIIPLEHHDPDTGSFLYIYHIPQTDRIT